MIQVIKHPCCGVVFAACVELHCYQDTEWMRDVRKYSKAGKVVEVVEEGESLPVIRCERMVRTSRT
jgi:hypothetical protein